MKICSKTYQVNNLVDGVSEYFRLLFTKECACVFNCMIHSTVLEFKNARKGPLWKMNQNECMQVEYIREEMEEKKYDVKPDPKSLGEFLF